MSYAIIRNSNYKTDNLAGLYKHNERKNTNYSNKNIEKNRTKENYSIKKCNTTYSKRFKELKEQYNLQGRIISTTNILCELIITSDEEFFKSIGEKETHRYFETAYKFVSAYQNLGEEYIISATVHMDEKTPHMHIVYIPVIHNLNKKSGKQENKIACSQYWKGKNSYGVLQDNFYSYMTKSGFKLERGLTKDNEHIPIEKLKQVTNYELQELQKNSLNEEQEIKTNDIEVLKKDYRRIIRNFNTIAKQYTRVKIITDKTINNYEKIINTNKELEEENIELDKENNRLNDFLEKTFEYVSLLFDFPKERLKRLVNDFVNRIKE